MTILTILLLAHCARNKSRKVIDLVDDNDVTNFEEFTEPMQVTSKLLLATYHQWVPLRVLLSHALEFGVVSYQKTSQYISSDTAFSCPCLLALRWYETERMTFRRRRVTLRHWNCLAT